MATGTQYSAWSAYKLPSGASAKRRVRTYYTWTTSETPTTFSITIKAYAQMQGGSATMGGNTVTVSATGQSSVSNTFKFVYGETTLHNPVNKTYTWKKTTAAQTVTVKSTYKVASSSLFAGTYVASGTFTIPALAPATISFDANNGNGTVPTAINTYVGVANTIPSNNLTRTGYTFNGWNTASDGSGTAYATGSTITPAGDVTLYAQWQTTYVKPEIQKLLAFRVADASGGASPTVTSTGTTGFCKFQLVGGANYTFTSATVQFGTATANSMTQSGTTVYGYSDVGVVAEDSAYTVKITVVVTGIDGVSRTYTDSTYISKAVPVFDATPNSFALGGVARDVTGDEKPFDCYMDASFYGNVDVTGKVNAKDSDFNGTININGIQIKGCHKIRTIRKGETSSYTYDTIGWYMDGAKTVLLEEKVSEQQNGIILVWSYYDKEPKDWSWNFTFIPKLFVVDNPSIGGMVTFMVNNATCGSVAVKYIYIKDDSIIGNDNNTKSGTGTSGIKYNNNKFVLRWVYGF